MTPSKLPKYFDTFETIGGMVEFFLFEGVQTSDVHVQHAAIAAAITNIDSQALAAIRPRRIDRQQFLGDWYDPARATLIRRGTWQINAATKATDPAITDLETLAGIGSGPIPPVGAGGQFAFAFLCPPYRLNAAPNVVQRLFDNIVRFILPPGYEATIYDYCDIRLKDVSPYFHAGAEWWGMYLFTIHVPALSQLMVIAASATD